MRLDERAEELMHQFLSLGSHGRSGVLAIFGGHLQRGADCSGSRSKPIRSAPRTSRPIGLRASTVLPRNSRGIMQQGLLFIGIPTDHDSLWPERWSAMNQRRFRRSWSVASAPTLQRVKQFPGIDSDKQTWAMLGRRHCDLQIRKGGISPISRPFVCSHKEFLVQEVPIRRQPDLPTPATGSPAGAVVRRRSDGI